MKRCLLVACSAFLLASCQGVPGDYYLGRGGDGEDEAGTGRPNQLILGRWEPVGGDKKGAVTVVQFSQGGYFHQMAQQRGAWGASMLADGYGRYTFLDDHTLELNLRRGKVKVEADVSRDELVLKYPGKKPEHYRRLSFGFAGGIGTAPFRGTAAAPALPVGTVRIRASAARAATAKAIGR
jgi:hypothetical protein